MFVMTQKWLLLRLPAVLLLVSSAFGQTETRTLAGKTDEISQGDVQIVSDTYGVDMAPYLRKAIATIRKNWYSLIPSSANAPQYRSGTVWIEFKIDGDGKVTAMKLLQPSGDTSLDRAAWGAITQSNRLEQLPKPLKEIGVVLRIKFLYNPDKGARQIHDN